MDDVVVQGASVGDPCDVRVVTRAWNSRSTGRTGPFRYEIWWGADGGGGGQGLRHVGTDTSSQLILSDPGLLEVVSSADVAMPDDGVNARCERNSFQVEHVQLGMTLRELNHAGDRRSEDQGVR